MKKHLNLFTCTLASLLLTVLPKPSNPAVADFDPTPSSEIQTLHKDYNISESMAYLEDLEDGDLVVWGPTLTIMLQE